MLQGRRRTNATAHPRVTVYVGVHLRFTATDDRTLDRAMLPLDFGLCMRVI